MPIDRILKVGLVQMAMSLDVEANLRKAISMSKEAADRGAQVVCLPELFTTLYFPREEDPEGNADRSAVLNTIPGMVTEELSRLAQDTGAIVIGGSIYEAADEGLYNTATVFEKDGRYLGKYRKTHIPHDEYFYEQHYFDAGDTGFQVFETSVGRLSVLICYDQWFPEAARSVALIGAEMIFYPTAIGTVLGIEQTEGDWQQAWENVMRGHAIANGTPVCAVNRVGIEGDSEFFGGSFICDAFGKTLARGGRGEEIVLADVDMDHGRKIREGWRFFHNRRPEHYGRLVQRTGP
ncbi:MAG TPA: carbon-nitrogen hydrolase [Methanomassiliicoccales archaeon]|nr:carbon-nitrogen hydrolase [Methanomassiliicoccales archaeon]